MSESTQYYDKFKIGQPIITDDNIQIYNISKTILDYNTEDKHKYNNMNDHAKQIPNFRPEKSYIDIIDKNFMNDRLIPDEDI